MLAGDCCRHHAVELTVDTVFFSWCRPAVLHLPTALMLRLVEHNRGELGLRGSQLISLTRELEFTRGCAM